MPSDMRIMKSLTTTSSNRSEEGKRQRDTKDGLKTSRAERRRATQYCALKTSPVKQFQPTDSLLDRFRKKPQERCVMQLKRKASVYGASQQGNTADLVTHSVTFAGK